MLARALRAASPACYFLAWSETRQRRLARCDGGRGPCALKPRGRRSRQRRGRERQQGSNPALRTDDRRVPLAEGAQLISWTDSTKRYSISISPCENRRVCSLSFLLSISEIACPSHWMALSRMVGQRPIENPPVECSLWPSAGNRALGLSPESPPFWPTRAPSLRTVGLRVLLRLWLCARLPGACNR